MAKKNSAEVVTVFVENDPLEKWRSDLLSLEAGKSENLSDYNDQLIDIDDRIGQLSQKLADHTSELHKSESEFESVDQFVQNQIQQQAIVGQLQALLEVAQQKRSSIVQTREAFAVTIDLQIEKLQLQIRIEENERRVKALQETVNSKRDEYLNAVREANEILNDLATDDRRLLELQGTDMQNLFMYCKYGFLSGSFTLPDLQINENLNGQGTLFTIGWEMRGYNALLPDGKIQNSYNRAIAEFKSLHGV